MHNTIFIEMFKNTYKIVVFFERIIIYIQPNSLLNIIIFTQVPALTLHRLVTSGVSRCRGPCTMTHKVSQKKVNK